MRKFIPFILGAAVIAPLYLSTPAQAQSYDYIQQLEQRVQDAKSRGDWNYAAQLERDLNQARLQYQQRNGMGENQQNYNNNNGYYRYNGNHNRGYYNRGRYNPNNPNQGYYDPNNPNRGYNYPRQTDGQLDRNGNWNLKR